MFQLIGSSLLFVHNEKSAEVWLIDFAKSIPLPGNVSITHRAPWIEGSHEDGYLLGLDNLIKLMAALEVQHMQRKKDSSQQKTNDLKEEEEGNSAACVSSEVREQEITSDSKTATKADSNLPREEHTPTDNEQQPSRVHQNSCESIGSSRSIASSFSNSLSEESKDTKLNDTSAATSSRLPNDPASKDSRLYLNCTPSNTKVLPPPHVRGDSIKVTQSSSDESHSPTDIRNMIKSSTEMNSIS